MLERQKIPYKLWEFQADVKQAAECLKLPPEMIFKTLVTTDTKEGYYVFCIPVNEELDLKKAAAAAGVKRIEMLKQKDLFPLTGYIHGGCSPVGMKKLFPTVLDSSAENRESILVSAGHVGMLMELAPSDLIRMVNASTDNITK